MLRILREARQHRERQSFAGAIFIRSTTRTAISHTMSDITEEQRIEIKAAFDLFDTGKLAYRPSFLRPACSPLYSDHLSSLPL